MVVDRQEIDPWPCTSMVHPLNNFAVMDPSGIPNIGRGLKRKMKHCYICKANEQVPETKSIRFHQTYPVRFSAHHK